jgi:hypothetical protein
MTLRIVEMPHIEAMNFGQRLHILAVPERAVDEVMGALTCLGIESIVVMVDGHPARWVEDARCIKVAIMALASLWRPVLETWWEVLGG